MPNTNNKMALGVVIMKKTLYFSDKKKAELQSKVAEMAFTQQKTMYESALWVDFY